MANLHVYYSIWFPLSNRNLRIYEKKKQLAGIILSGMTQGTHEKNEIIFSYKSRILKESIIHPVLSVVCHFSSSLLPRCTVVTLQIQSLYLWGFCTIERKIYKNNTTHPSRKKNQSAWRVFFTDIAGTVLPTARTKFCSTFVKHNSWYYEHFFQEQSIKNHWKKKKQVVAGLGYKDNPPSEESWVVRIAVVVS